MNRIDADSGNGNWTLTLIWGVRSNITPMWLYLQSALASAPTGFTVSAKTLGSDLDTIFRDAGVADSDSEALKNAVFSAPIPWAQLLQ